MNTPRPIQALEDTPANALAYMLLMADLMSEEHDRLWQQITHAVRGIGHFYVDLCDQVCQDCCPPGRN